MQKDINSNSASTVNRVKTNTNSTKKANDNLEELEMLVKLLHQPEDVLWTEESAGIERKLTAVMLFLPTDVQKLIAEAEKHGTASNVLLEPADWYPKELLTQQDLSSGPLPGKQYPANEFFQAPYNAGRLIRIDGTDYFIVELVAK